MTDKQIDQLIERYFDGDTTVAEERELRRLLLSGKYDTPLSTQALAVMSLAAVKRKPQAKSPDKKYGWRVAASIAVLIMVGGSLLLRNTGTNHTNDIADGSYINGIPVEASAAIAIMNADLHLVSEVSNDVNESIKQNFSVFNNIFSE